MKFEVDQQDPSWEDFEHAEPALGMRDRSVFFQHHQPAAFDIPYHYHPSIEINFLQGCDMTYSFSGHRVTVPDGSCCVFWAAHPHKPMDVTDNGWITNAYVSLSTFMSWSFPQEFTTNLLGGCVMIADEHDAADQALVQRWSKETENTSQAWQRVHIAELQARLTRMATVGWTALHHQNEMSATSSVTNGLLQFERMLRFVAENFSRPLNIDEVANEGGVTTNQALALFRKLLGRTIKGHITDLRVYHAKMLLSETEEKIVSISLDCGYSSLSAFYDAFKQQTGLSPAAFREKAKREYFF